MAATLPAAVCERLQLLPTYFDVTPYCIQLFFHYDRYFLNPSSLEHIKDMILIIIDIDKINVYYIMF